MSRKFWSILNILNKTICYKKCKWLKARHKSGWRGGGSQLKGQMAKTRGGKILQLERIESHSSCFFSNLFWVTTSSFFKTMTMLLHITKQRDTKSKNPPIFGRANSEVVGTESSLPVSGSSERELESTSRQLVLESYWIPNKEVFQIISHFGIPLVDSFTSSSHTEFCRRDQAGASSP